MPYRLVTIGTSLGGFEALAVVLGSVPKTFPVPIAVVQHRSSEDSDGIVPLLSIRSAMPVVEVEDKQMLKPGYVFLCPPNYHMLIEGDHLALSTDMPVMHARPSIDVLFESAGESFGPDVIAVLLTGMSRDGSAGVAKVKQCGGLVIVQDPATAAGSTMPQSAISTVNVDEVLTLSEIGPYLVQLCASEVKDPCPTKK